jgi:hypothetical protein
MTMPVSEPTPEPVASVGVSAPAAVPPFADPHDDFAPIVPTPVAAEPLPHAPTAAEIAAELYKLQKADQAPAEELPENPPSPVNLFAKGNIVTHRWLDPHDGLSERHGIVVETLPDEGFGARSVVAWLGSKSGPIGDHELTAV